MILNCTPHPVCLLVDGEKITIPPQGEPIRVATLPDVPAGHVAVDGLQVPVFTSGFSPEVTGLPPEVPGTTLVVSLLAYQASKGRGDLVIPHNTVRDKKGNVIGCTALARPRL